MSDFTHEELIDASDRLVGRLLDQAGMEEPPVDTIDLATRIFRLEIREEEPPEEPRYGDPPRRPRGGAIVFRPDYSEESRHLLCARAIVHRLLPELFQKLGITPGTENRSAQTTLTPFLTPRLLLPTRWFGRDARRARYDLEELKSLYLNVGYEMIALRFLDLDEPCVIAIVDDGTVSQRKGNRFPATKKLHPAEVLCLEQVQASEIVKTVRKEGWTVRGCPIPGGPFNRILLHALPDEV